MQWQRRLPAVPTCARQSLPRGARSLRLPLLLELLDAAPPRLARTHTYAHALSEVGSLCTARSR